MKVLIPLAGFGKRMRPYTWSRAKPLLQVAGKTVIGHLLDSMSDLTTEEVIFVVGYKGDQVKNWISEHYPHLDSHFVVQEELLGQAHALWLCRDFMDEGELVIVFGDGIVGTRYNELADPSVDVVMLVQEVEDPRKFGVVATDEGGFVTQLIEKPDHDRYRQAIAGVHWFKHGRLIREALDKVIADGRMTKGEYYLADAYQVLLEQAAKIRAKEVVFWLDAGNPENILDTNERLLSLGYGSDDAIDRSYAEDFTVLPPVFIHDDAEVDSCVIGPYVTIGPQAKVKNSIIKNSIIDAGAIIKDCHLDGALIGENTKVTGRRKSLFLGDDSIVDIG
jgi:glucose-1-phosphate thymidylyltransferase